MRIAGICLDCADAEAMKTFYESLFGYVETWRDVDGPPQTGWIGLEHPDGGVNISFQEEPWYEPPTWPEEPERQAKMMHFEVAVDDVEAAAAAVVAAGGRVAPHQPPDRADDDLCIVLDPAGHPFCLCGPGN